MSTVSGETISRLRNLVGLITNTQEEALHEQVALCLSIIHSSPILEDAYTYSATGGRSAAELTSLLHKYKTRLSALLQSRLPQARWAVICLVKSSIETSSHMLQSSASWIPHLIKFVTRPDPSVCTERAITTLTRIFALTVDKAALTRELTTPHLPSFLGALFSLDPARSEHLLTILKSVQAILRSHPTTFRPFAQRTLSLTREIQGLHSIEVGSKYYPQQIRYEAQVVFACLHRSAPQKSHSEEWVNAIKSIIDQAEEVGNTLFQCLIEDRDREDGSNKIPPNQSNQFSLDGQGMSQLTSLLQLLRAFISQPSPESPSALPVSPLLQLLTRLFSLTSKTPAHPLAIPTNYQLFLAHLPSIHCDALALVRALIERLSHEHSSSILLRLYNEVVYVASSNTALQTCLAMYATLESIINTSGNTFTIKEGKPLNKIISSACDYLIPPPPPTISVSKEITSAQPKMLLTQPTSTYKKRKVPPNPNKSNTPQASTAHADNFLASTSSIDNVVTYIPETHVIISSFLTTILSHIPPTILRSEIRSKMEQTVILTQNVDGVLAAVLYPSGSGKRGSSILPHLVGLVSQARAPISTTLGVEGTIHPRMQVVASKSSDSSDSDSESQSEDDEADEEMPEDQQQDTTMHDTSIMDLPNVLNTPQPQTLESDPLRYPTPPPAPVPHHASLPRSPVPAHAALPPQPPKSPVLSHAQLPLPSQRSPSKSPNTVTVSLPPPPPRPPTFIAIPTSNPSGSRPQVMPPSPLRQSMSIFEPEDPDRESKRLKLDEQGIQPGEGLGLGIKEGSVLAGAENEVKMSDGFMDGDDGEDSDMEIPTIVMGDDSDDDDDSDNE